MHERSKDKHAVARLAALGLAAATLLATAPAMAADTSATTAATAPAQTTDPVAYVLGLNRFRKYVARPDMVRPTAADVRRALGGELVVKSGDLGGPYGHFIHVSTVIDTDIADVWMTVIDRRDYGKISPNITESFILERRPTSFIYYNALEAPLVSTRQQVLDCTANRKLYEASRGRMWEHSWNLLDKPELQHWIDRALASGKLKNHTAEELKDDAVVVAHNTGSWLLAALPDGRTWAETYVINDPGGHIPDFIAHKVAALATPRTVKAFATWAKTRAPGHFAADHEKLLGPDARWIAPSEFRQRYGTYVNDPTPAATTSPETKKSP